MFIPDKLARYFHQLKVEQGVVLDGQQKAWYVKKKETQGSKMMREFPSYPQEAFEQPTEGAYFADEMVECAEDGRIVVFNHDPLTPVNTFWDLGLRDTDTTCIWFHQRIGLQDHFIDFVEDHGKGLEHYARIISEKKYRYGTHYLPHDSRVREIGNQAKPRYRTLENADIGAISIVERTLHKIDSIHRVRDLLPNCVFHSQRCADGISALRAYRREYDEKLKVWMPTPLHDWASNPTDAFMTFSDGFVPGSAVSRDSRARRNSNRRRTIATI